MRTEREADNELLELCQSGAAKGSLKMRNVCIQVQRDRASPLFLKAVVRAVSLSWSEFVDTVASPAGFVGMLLFVLASFALPSVPWLRLLSPEPETSGADSDHVVVLHGAALDRSLCSRLSRRFAKPQRHTPFLELGEEA